MQYQILFIHKFILIYVDQCLKKYRYMDIYNSQLRYGFRYLVYLVSPLLLERLTSISILLYQFEGQAYVDIHSILIMILQVTLHIYKTYNNYL